MLVQKYTPWTTEDKRSLRNNPIYIYASGYGKADTEFECILSYLEWKKIFTEIGQDQWISTGENGESTSISYHTRNQFQMDIRTKCLRSSSTYSRIVKHLCSCRWEGWGMGHMGEREWEMPRRHLWCEGQRETVSGQGCFLLSSFTHEALKRLLRGNSTGGGSGQS